MHMLAVIAYGEDAFRLIDVAGRDVGWVRSKTFGFGGFASENAAHAAAIDGARALVRCLKREFGVTHLELGDQPRTRTIRDGDGEWVADGHVRVARLLRMENGGGCGQEFAIEFRLPPYANHAVAINVAQIAYGALSQELTGASGPSALLAAHDATG
jgi:hypothetical protein